jgi:hypothetical protein
MNKPLNFRSKYFTYNHFWIFSKSVNWVLLKFFVERIIIILTCWKKSANPVHHLGEIKKIFCCIIFKEVSQRKFVAKVDRVLEFLEIRGDRCPIDQISSKSKLEVKHNIFSIISCNQIIF